MPTSGKMFESEIRHALKHYEQKLSPRFFWYRIPDTYEYAQRWCPNCKKAIHSAYIAEPTPADFAYIYGGTPCLLECKSSLSRRYMKEWVKPHQTEDMEKAEKAGGKAWFLFNYRQTLSKRRHPDEKPVYDENKVFALTPRQVKALWKLRDKSVPWETLARAAVEVPRKDGVWWLEVLFVV